MVSLVSKTLLVLFTDHIKDNYKKCGILFEINGNLSEDIYAKKQLFDCSDLNYKEIDT